jgi:hypothetical protein
VHSKALNKKETKILKEFRSVCVSFPRHSISSHNYEQVRGSCHQNHREAVFSAFVTPCKQCSTEISSQSCGRGSNSNSAESLTSKVISQHPASIVLQRLHSLDSPMTTLSNCVPIPPTLPILPIHCKILQSTLVLRTSTDPGSLAKFDQNFYRPSVSSMTNSANR